MPAALHSAATGGGAICNTIGGIRRPIGHAAQIRVVPKELVTRLPPALCPIAVCTRLYRGWAPRVRPAARLQGGLDEQRHVNMANRVMGALRVEMG